MPVNLRDEKLLNQYIERLVYHGGEYKPFQPSQMKDKDFIEANQAPLILAITYQWMKTKVREYLTDKEDAPFLSRVTKAKELNKPKTEIKIDFLKTVNEFSSFEKALEKVIMMRV